MLGFEKIDIKLKEPDCVRDVFNSFKTTRDSMFKIISANMFKLCSFW